MQSLVRPLLHEQRLSLLHGLREGVAPYHLAANGLGLSWIQVAQHQLLGRSLCGAPHRDVGCLLGDLQNGVHALLSRVLSLAGCEAAEHLVGRERTWQILMDGEARNPRGAKRGGGKSGELPLAEAP